MKKLPALETRIPHTSPSSEVPSANKVGRPSRRTSEIVAAICEHIRTEGMSDSAAGSFAGGSTTSLSRWKQDDEDFALGLERARAEFERACLREVREARKRDGSSDWRAYAWLLQNSSAEGYSRRTKRKREEADNGPRVTLEEIERLVQVRLQEVLQSLLGDGAVAAGIKMEMGGMIPEIPEIAESLAPGEKREEAQAPEGEGVSEGAQANESVRGEMCAIVPEIPETPETGAQRYGVPPSGGQTVAGTSGSANNGAISEVEGWPAEAGTPYLGAECADEMEAARRIIPEIPETPAPRLNRRERRAEERRLAQERKRQGVSNQN